MRVKRHQAPVIDRCLGLGVFGVSVPVYGACMTPYHPSIAAILQYFDYRHLPEELAPVSKQFAKLAFQIADCSDGPEATVALRKLLESKDAAVRARLTDKTTDDLFALREAAYSS